MKLSAASIKDCKLVQQYGCERSGSFYTQKILMANFSDVFVLRVEKHEGPTMPDGTRYLMPRPVEKMHEIMSQDGYEIDDMTAFCRELENRRERREISYIITARDPYATVLSCIRRDMTLRRATLNWNVCYRRYLNFFDANMDRTYIFKHESFLSKFQSTLLTLGNLYGLTPSPYWPVDIPQHAHSVRVQLGKAIEVLEETSFTEAKDTLLRDKYLDILGHDSIKVISMHLDPEVCKALGYRIVKWN